VYYYRLLLGFKGIKTLIKGGECDIINPLKRRGNANLVIFCLILSDIFGNAAPTWRLRVSGFMKNYENFKN
jgi:hypothetical protein